jgi:hypothetical protein
MTHRYRSAQFYPFLRSLPDDWLEHVAYQGAPPRYVLVTFTSDDVLRYFDEHLGPSIEPNYSLVLNDHKDMSRTKKAKDKELDHEAV